MCVYSTVQAQTLRPALTSPHLCPVFRRQMPHPSLPAAGLAIISHCVLTCTRTRTHAQHHTFITLSVYWSLDRLCLRGLALQKTKDEGVTRRWTCSVLLFPSLKTQLFTTQTHTQPMVCAGPFLSLHSTRPQDHWIGFLTLPFRPIVAVLNEQKSFN